MPRSRARETTVETMTTAFVLQGGAALAAPQVGMLQALAAAGIQPDLVVGSSAGALNGVAFAQDPTESGVARLWDTWSRVRRRSVFPIRPVGVLAGLTGRRAGLVPAGPLRSWIAAGVTLRDLRDAPVPVAVVTTDADTGEAVPLRAGDPVDALLASSSVPGIFPAVTIDGRRLADGGVAADLPVRAAEQLGATRVYVLPRAAIPGPPARPTVVDALVRAASQVLVRASYAEITHATADVRVLPTPTTASANPVDFRDSQRLMRAGHDLATRWLAGETGDQRLQVRRAAAVALAA
jgi:NTE family protein